MIRHLNVSTTCLCYETQCNGVYGKFLSKYCVQYTKARTKNLLKVLWQQLGDLRKMPLPSSISAHFTCCARHSIRMDYAPHFLQPTTVWTVTGWQYSPTLMCLMPCLPGPWPYPHNGGRLFSRRNSGQGVQGKQYRDWCRGVVPILPVLHDVGSVCKRLQQVRFKILPRACAGRKCLPHHSTGTSPLTLRPHVSFL